MQRCPQCGDMTAQANLYTGQLVCYKRGCGYEDPIKKTDKKPRVEDVGLWFVTRRSSSKG